MKKTLTIVTLSLAVGMAGLSSHSCKALAKHWTKKQVKKFVQKCEEGTANKFGERAGEICNCLATKAEEKYPNIDDALKMSVLEMVKLAIDCR